MNPDILATIETAHAAAQWTLDDLASFGIGHDIRKEYVVGAYAHAHPRTKSGAIGARLGMKVERSKSGDPTRCKTVENYRDFYRSVIARMKAESLSESEALDKVWRERADARTAKAKDAKAKARTLADKETEAANTDQPTDVPTAETESTPAPEVRVDVTADVRALLDIVAIMSARLAEVSESADDLTLILQADAILAKFVTA